MYFMFIFIYVLARWPNSCRDKLALIITKKRMFFWLKKKKKKKKKKSILLTLIAVWTSNLVHSWQHKTKSVFINGTDLLN